VGADTAGSAKLISENSDISTAVLASELAAEIYNLKIIRRNVEDASHNTTRFIILSSEPDDAEPNKQPTITSMVFRVRNVPASLYKAMGGFATNNVNVIKLESYIVGGSFSAAQFYVDIDGHPHDANVRLALEELDFFSSELKIFGVYNASEMRKKTNKNDNYLK
jgi:prephenate dehydratase